ncbi:TIGR04283 family arsenosugar biosynthesis glycosyltransferase [Limisalsivibrio acetivorans]|uniref:TIGR04283 family arsenosugar biosynthesis glycosyltransferase n=1 Tax=Limisalsivibrio acetivorans TaxID=1304888 RepID=UPI0003B69932|nr:TIGR04283 family arsenosugar biosynthesis glycosyltransferase [Limisalsivibrio acetivorans]
MSFSVIIPVYSEESTINRQLEHVASIFQGHCFEIIVIDGHQEDSTLKVVEDNSIIKVSSARGRGIQLQKGLEAASKDICLFLHADTKLPQDAPAEINRILGEYYAGAFDLRIDDWHPAFRFIEQTAALRSRLTKIPYGDQAVFTRRGTALAIGFEPIPIMEDVTFMKELKGKGFSVGFSDRCVYTSSRRWRKEGILRCTLRNWKLAVLYNYGVHPSKLAEEYSPNVD